jgi:hypothetical protein
MFFNCMIKPFFHFDEREMAIGGLVKHRLRIKNYEFRLKPVT